MITMMFILLLIVIASRGEATMVARSYNALFQPQEANMSQLWDVFDQLQAEGPAAMKEAINAAFKQPEPMQALSNVISLEGCPSGASGILENDLNQEKAGNLALLSHCYPRFKESGDVSLESLLGSLESIVDKEELAVLPNALVEQVSGRSKQSPSWSQTIKKRIDNNTIARRNLLQAVRVIAQGEPKAIERLLEVFPSISADEEVMSEMTLIITQTADEKTLPDKLKVLGQERIRDFLGLVENSALVSPAKLRRFTEFISADLQDKGGLSRPTTIVGDSSSLPPPPSLPSSPTLTTTTTTTTTTPPPPPPPPTIPPIFTGQDLGASPQKTLSLFARINQGNFSLKDATQRKLKELPSKNKSDSNDPKALLLATSEAISRTMNKNKHLESEEDTETSDKDWD